MTTLAEDGRPAFEQLRPAAMSVMAAQTFTMFKGGMFNGIISHFMAGITDRGHIIN